MKKINIRLIILLSCLAIDSYAQNKDLDTPHNSTSSLNLFIQQSVASIKKHAWIIALTPAILYHHQEIKETIMQWPYTSSLAVYILLNYLCDSIVNYHQQQSLLNMIALLKKTTLYLVICHGIKNHMHQKQLSIEPFIDDEDFFNNITENIPYSFNEVNLITLKSYQELKSCLQSLNITINVESEEFVFLCHASTINVHSLLYLVQNDPELYQKIYHFQKDPQNHFIPLVTHLKLEMTQTFMNLEHQLLTSNIQTRALP